MLPLAEKETRKLHPDGYAYLVSPFFPTSSDDIGEFTLERWILLLQKSLLLIMTSRGKWEEIHQLPQPIFSIFNLLSVFFRVCGLALDSAWFRCPTSFFSFSFSLLRGCCVEFFLRVFLLWEKFLARGLRIIEGFDDDECFLLSLPRE